MRHSAILTSILAVLLTACASSTVPPVEAEETVPMTAVTEAGPVTLTPYSPETEGAKELYYNDRWKFCIQEKEPEPGPNSYMGAASLLCCERTTGQEWELDELEYGPQHSYWDTASLYAFTGILGRDGIVFAHGIGAGCLAIDFYEVSDSGAKLIARCNNNVWTADFDGDGQRELLSQYHNMGYLDLYWLEGDNHVCFCSLNETARDRLGLPPDEWVSLEIQDGSGEIQAVRAVKNGENWEYPSCTLELDSLWEWEKARREFRGDLPSDTDSGRDIR